MRSHKLVQQLLALSAIILGSLTLTNSSQGAEVLATPVNSETQLSSKNILNGTNYFLVKPNPVQLSPDEQVFLTKKGQIYTTVIPKDLENPALKQQILVAKMNKDGSIKIMTLPNVGYMHIQTIQEANGNKKTFFITNKGNAVNIYRVPFKAPSPPINMPTTIPPASSTTQSF